MSYDNEGFRHRSLPDQVADHIVVLIAKGEISAGDRLYENELCKTLGVSRIPVREALTRLEEQGLVTTQRYRGAVVSRLSIEEVEELFEFRALVEPEVLRRSIARISPEALDRAAAFADAFATEPDTARWGELNRRFHYALYEDSGRPYYLQTINAALDRVDRYSRVQLVQTDGMRRARLEHEEILRAAVARDADKAASLTRDHILGAGRSLIDFLRRTRSSEANGKQK